MAKRIHLGMELKHRFREQGRPISRVARDLGLSVNSLRSWLRRNVYPKDQLLRIMDAAGIRGDSSTLAEMYEFEVARGRRTYGRRLAELASDVSPDLADILAAVFDRWRVFQGNGPPVSQELHALFRGLGPDDIYTCCLGDTLPTEWSGTGWGTLGVELGAAVNRGSILVYLFPSAEAIRRLQLHGLYEFLSPETVEGAIAQFRTRVAKTFSELTESELAERVVGLSIDAGVFLAPRQQYIFVNGAKDDGVGLAGFLRLNDSPAAGIPLLIPLGQEIASGFLSLLLSEAERSGCQSLYGRLGGPRCPPGNNTRL